MSSAPHVPKHRAAPAQTQAPAALTPLGPRHSDRPPRFTRRTVRGALTLSGLAVAATGVAVTAGMVQSPEGALDPAGSTARVSTGAAQAPSQGVLQRRIQTVSRSADRRTARDPAKTAALGLSTGPAVTGRETLAAQSPQSIAAALLPTFGYSSSEMSCLVPLWMGESGWRVNAENSSSGAYGIPQSLPGSKMATVAGDWRTNGVTQIKWGLGYIQERYGSPCGAWSFKQGHGWY